MSYYWGVTPLEIQISDYRSSPAVILATNTSTQVLGTLLLQKLTKTPRHIILYAIYQVQRERERCHVKTIKVLSVVDIHSQIHMKHVNICFVLSSIWHAITFKICINFYITKHSKYYCYMYKTAPSDVFQS